MLRLFSSKAQGCKDFCKQSKPCHVGIHEIALTKYSQMGTHLPGFRSFFRFLQHFVLAKLATSSIGVKTSLHAAGLYGIDPVYLDLSVSIITADNWNF